MPKLITLKKRSEFVAMNAGAARAAAHGLVLQVRPNGTESAIRAGYTAAKKIEKSAVRRNRMKRRLRAAAAAVLPVHGLPAHDYVLIARPQTVTRPYALLCEDLKYCLRKAGAFKP